MTAMKVLRTCQRCSNTFTWDARPSRIKAGWGKYCSRACLGSASAKNNKPWEHVRGTKAWNNEQIDVTCLNCGVMRSVSKSRANTYVYCSRSCMHSDAPRRVIREGGVTYIGLNNGLRTMVDDDMVDALARRCWQINTSGYVHQRMWARVDGEWVAEYVSMHRTIMNAPDGMEVDHRDGNTLDNRRSNLRLATHTQNTWNRKMLKNNTSGFTGVYKENDGWVAKIHHNGASTRIGKFTTAIEASEAYKRKALELRGEFAKVN